MTSNTLSQTQRRQLHVFTTAQLIAFLVSILERWTKDFNHVSFNCKFSLFLLPAVQASMIFVSPLFPSRVQNMLPTPPRPPWLSKYDAVEINYSFYSHHNVHSLLQRLDDSHLIHIEKSLLFYFARGVLPFQIYQLWSGLIQPRYYGDTYAYKSLQTS